MKNVFILILIIFSFVACNTSNDEQDLTGITLLQECKKSPGFVKLSGFNPNACAISTLEKHIDNSSALGIVLQEFNANGQAGRVWQHPSWKKVGHLSPIVINEFGDVFTGPVPLINILENNPDSQNILYKINTENAELNKYIELPADQKPSINNPYGILGLAFDCDNKFIYITSVMGSTPQNEVGRIFCVSTVEEEPKIIDILKGVDAIGVGVAILNNQKRLFFGGARSSNIFSIELDEKGKFKGKARKEFTISNIGPWGDEKARKIRFDKNGNMVINCTSFEYNLKAGINGASQLLYRYNIINGIWEQVNKNGLLESQN